MNETEFNRHIQEKARHVANFLNTLTPYERSLVLGQAQSIWDERQSETAQEQTGAPQEQTIADAHEDLCLLITHWMGEMVRRLSPEALVEVVELLKGIDEDARWQRLVDGMAESDDLGQSSLN